MFSNSPVFCRNNQITDRPGFFIENEVLDVSDFPIGGTNVMTDDVVGAPQARVPGFLPLESGLPFFLNPGDVGAIAPGVGTVPVIGPAVVPVVLGFILARHGLVTIERGTFLDLLFGQIHRQNFFGKIGRFERVGGD